MLVRGKTVTTGNPALGAAISVGLPGVDPADTETYRLSSKNWSLFGQTEYDLTDKLTLITGARYSRITSMSTIRRSSPTAGNRCCWPPTRALPPRSPASTVSPRATGPRA
jgi:outer membrane receptor protein involved in Fe transport